jgi:hypothetical protein
MLRNKRVLAAAGAAALAVGITAGAGALTANAGTGIMTLTATTALHGHPDSGYAGDDWANDSITRVATLTFGLPVPASNCGATATMCFGFYGTIKDTGIAYAVTGATSPGAQGVPITGTPSAITSGGTDVTFDASSDAPSAALVPKAVNGAGTSTADWMEQFFPAGTAFSSPDLPNWSWTYTDSVTCEYWVDAYNVSQADSGDITGANHCPPAPHTGPDPVTATTSGPDLTVAWPSVGGANVYEIDVTGPSGGNKASPTVTKDRGVFSIATIGDSGYAKVRAGIRKSWDGKTWTAWGPYSATKTWKF